MIRARNLNRGRRASAHKTLTVSLGKFSYPIHIGENLLPQAGSRLARLGFDTAPIVITNPTVFKLHGWKLCKSLQAVYGPISVIHIGDGERYKDQRSLNKIYDGLFHARADRKSWLVAFGGGVVGDIAGFAAATYMRGIRYVGVPTTLLAQVDSSVGGKVGINVPQGKNLIGSFHQPSAVLADTGVLKSLPARELAAGLFEVIKCGAIRSTAMIGYLEKHLSQILSCQSEALQHIVLESLRIKAGIVARDEKEKHLRMVLNFGHTVGHAIEAATHFKRFKHGEAVAWGMLAALGYSMELGLTPREEAVRLASLIDRVEKMPSLKGIELSELWDALIRDKKFRAGDIQLVLVPKLGVTRIRDCIRRQHFKAYLKHFLRRGKRIF
jgi:3-dehydroquinate synthase